MGVCVHTHTHYFNTILKEVMRVSFQICLVDPFVFFGDVFISSVELTLEYLHHWVLGTRPGVSLFLRTLAFS